MSGLRRFLDMKIGKIGPFDGFDVVSLLGLAATFVAVALAPFAAEKYGDRHFHEEAMAFAAFLRGAGDWASVRLRYAPGPSLYYTIPYALVRPGSDEGTFWLAGFVWTVLWMAVALLVLRRAAERISPAIEGAAGAAKTAGRLAVALVLLFPFSAYYSFAIVAETPAYLGMTLFVFGWSLTLDPAATDRVYRRGRRLAVAGMTLTLLCRPNAVPVLGLAFVAAFLLWRKGDSRSRREAALATRVAVSSLAIFFATAWVIRFLPGNVGNPQVGALIGVAAQGRFQFRTDLWDWREFESRVGSRDHEDFKALKQAHLKRSEQEGIPFAQLESEWYWKDMREHVTELPRQAAVRALFGQVNRGNSTPPGKFRLGPLRGPPGYLVFHLIINFVNIVVLGSLFVFLWRQRGSLARYWPLWAPFLALLVTHSLLYMEPRYLFTPRPPLLALTAVVLAAAINRLRARSPAPHAV